MVSTISFHGMNISSILIKIDFKFKLPRVSACLPAIKLRQITRLLRTLEY
jgi:hypothetical protein